MPKRTLARKSKLTVPKKSTRKEVDLNWDDEDIEDQDSSDNDGDGVSHEESSDEEANDTAEQKRKRYRNPIYSYMLLQFPSD